SQSATGPQRPRYPRGLEYAPTAAGDVAAGQETLAPYTRTGLDRGKPGRPSGRPPCEVRWAPEGQGAMRTSTRGRGSRSMRRRVLAATGQRRTHLGRRQKDRSQAWWG